MTTIIAYRSIISNNESPKSVRMSFGITITTALFFASGVTGISTIGWKNAERAVCRPADVADLRRTDLLINSSSAEWYSEGMELFAYRLSGRYWIKRTITWTVTSYLRGDERKPPQVIDRILTDAFQKWAVASGSRLRFPRVSSGQQADIEFSFEAMPMIGMKRIVSDIKFPRSGAGALDNAGGPVRIIFCSLRQWSRVEGIYYYNLRIIALQHIGHALGLGDSDRSNALMFSSISNARENSHDPVLREDDISGIQAVLNTSSSSGSTSGAHGHAGSVSSGSTTRAFGRMSLGSSGPPTGSYGRGNPPSSRPPGRGRGH